MEKIAMRLRPGFCEALLFGSLLVTVNAFAGEERDSLDWLKFVVSATHQTNYTGVFVYQHDNQVETSRIIHIVEPDSEYEKLESMDGPKREIIRHHGQVWCFINQKMEQVDSRHGRTRFLSLQPEQLSELSANYRIKKAGEERVAEHNAQVILLQPKDNLRYVHKIWAHKDSGLLLKAAVLGDKNKLVEQYAFTQLQIGGDIDRSWIDKIASNANSTTGISNSGRDASAGSRSTDSQAPPAISQGGKSVNSGWLVNALPAGFKKTMEIQRPMRGKHAPVTQLVFSDGLSAISVFIEPADGDADDVEGLSSRGAVNLYHKVVDKNLYTVVGEVPPRTVMQVFDSIRHSRE
jgi:sigma-E factor negative regulatory protein RseB